MLEDDEYELLDLLLAESRRPVTFIAMFDRDDIPEAVRDTLRKAAPLIERGARPQTSPLPLTREVNMRNPFAFAAFPSWGQSVHGSIEIGTSGRLWGPGISRSVSRGLEKADDLRQLVQSQGARGALPALKRFELQSIAEIAGAQGKDGVDAFLDLTLQDDLEIEFTLSTFNHRVDRMKEILGNRDILIGLGDGGAHVDMLCDSGYPTYLLGTWVREHQALTLEEGVRRLTSDPADFYGIKDRGRLKPGLAADIVIFDPHTVGSSNRGERRYDLPGGAKRMVMPSRGVLYTIVNGACVFADGCLTEARAGQVLRS